jgi:hypothetical protein
MQVSLAGPGFLIFNVPTEILAVHLRQPKSSATFPHCAEEAETGNRFPILFTIYLLFGVFHATTRTSPHYDRNFNPQNSSVPV